MSLLTRTPLLALSFLAAACPAWAGLVTWYKMDDASGATVAADASGTGANATVFNGGAFQPAAGRFGGAIFLDGANDYLEVADRAEHKFPVGQSFSLAVWFKSDGTEASLPAEYGNGANQGLISKTYFGTSYLANYYQMQLTVPATGATTQAFFSFDSRLSSTSATPFRFPTAPTAPDAVDNAWHQFVAVMDRTAGQMRLYVDGALYASLNTSAAAGGGQWDMGSAGPLVIGNHFNRYCRGWFDDVGMWNHALGTTEITTIYTNGIAGLGDTDGDGLLDTWEVTYFGNIAAQNAAGNPDTDGLTNAQELAAGTNPTLADTDSDGLTDGAEVNTHLTNPTLADTDSDGLTDGAEVNTHGTNPKLADTDSDNYSDGVEIAAGTNPNNAASFPPPALANVHINEFVTENQPRPNDPNAPVDMDGEYPDWIELKNNEAAPVTLTNWQLSDDPLNLAKWKFAATTIPANGYLIVFASGRSRSITGVQPHTSFKLGSSGDLILSVPNGMGGSTVVSQVTYPDQKLGFSYGRTDNTTTGALTHFSAGTPGAANVPGNAVSGFVADTSFSVRRGIFSAPITVTITSTTPGATIAWTVNGSAPSPTNGTQVPAPDGLTGPTATVNISSTTLLRARAYKTGMGASNIDTHSYIFPANVMTQNAPTPSMNLAPADTLAWGSTGADLSNISAFPGLTFWGVNQAIATDPVADNQFKQDDLMKLPTLSLVGDWRHLFGPNITAGDGGIYPPATGVAVEGVDRVASLEFINPTASLTDPNTVRGFQTDGNIHVFGGTSQNRWKSYKLSLRFQCMQDVNYRVYGDDATNTFKNFTLDATMNNTWMHPTDANQRNRSSFVRDFVMADLQNRMGQRGFNSRPCHLYLNGMYWGIYWMHEKPDHHFNAAYYGGESDDYDVFKHSTHPNFAESDPHVNTLAQNPALPVARPTSGNPAGNSTCVTNFEALLDLLGTGNVGANPGVLPDLSVQANYDAVAAMLDIDAFIDYMMLNFLAGNQDWADKNLYAARKRTGGKWRFFSWDAEHVFRTGTENFIASAGNEAAPLWRNGNPKQIHTRLRTSPEYRLRFADRIRQHMFNDGALTVAGMTDAFNDRLDEITDAVRAESARWGHIRASLNSNIPYKRSNWLTERNRLTVLESGGNSLIQNRWNLYMGPTGQFRQAGNGPLYPATEAPNFSQHGGAVPAGYSLTISNPGGAGTIYYTLDGSDPRTAWTSAAAGTAYTPPLTLNSPVTVKARVLNGTTWSALTEAFFSVNTVPASAANLVISEFNYNPSNPTTAEGLAGFENANDFEYIELLNISASAVDLRGCAFTAGVTFNFNNGSIYTLPPGGRVLIVENAAAFAYRYGAGLPVAGEFELSTGLSNGGEIITLTAADGVTPIKSFAYNDRNPWPEAADGAAGYSLVLLKPQSNPDHSIAQNWRPSSAVQGTPGGTDTQSYATWKSANGVTSDHADDDRDGTSNALEYLFKTNPASAASRPAFTGGVTTINVDPGPGLPPVPGDYLTLTFDRDPTADDVTYLPEISTDLNNWSNSMTDLVRVSVTPNPDGTQTEVWRSTTAVPGDQRRYGRVRVTVP